MIAVLNLNKSDWTPLLYNAINGSLVHVGESKMLPVRREHGHVGYYEMQYVVELFKRPRVAHFTFGRYWHVKPSELECTRK
jgi:hypothetical protein